MTQLLHAPTQSRNRLVLSPALSPETVDHQLVILVVTHVSTVWVLVDGQSGVTARKHYVQLILAVNAHADTVRVLVGWSNKT